MALNVSAQDADECDALSDEAPAPVSLGRNVFTRPRPYVEIKKMHQWQGGFP
jgi:hypothetical protein